jgi:hypothetical protein
MISYVIFQHEKLRQYDFVCDISTWKAKTIWFRMWYFNMFSCWNITYEIISSYLFMLKYHIRNHIVLSFHVEMKIYIIFNTSSNCTQYLSLSCRCVDGFLMFYLKEKTSLILYTQLCTHKQLGQLSITHDLVLFYWESILSI